MPSTHPGRIGELDSLRALAVIAVIVDHLLVFAWRVPSPVSAVAFWGGLAAVRYFFVLSGFVIIRRLMAEFARTGTISLRHFWVRRGFRILPALGIYLAVVTGLGCCHLIRTDAPSLRWSVLFVANIFSVDWFHEHLWSLSVEEQFYLFAPLAALWLLGRQRRYAGVLLAVVYVTCLFWHRVQHVVQPVLPEAKLDFLSMFRFIVAGVALGLFAPELGRWLRRIPGPAIAAVALATILVRDLPIGHYWLKIGLQCWQPLAILAVIGWVAAAPERCHWLQSAPLQALGRRSYSLYLWQQLFLGLPTEYAFRMTPLGSLLGVGGAVLCAFASYRWVEKPLLRTGQRLGGQTGECLG